MDSKQSQCPPRKYKRRKTELLSWDHTAALDSRTIPQLEGTHHLLPRPKHAQLAEAHVEGGAPEGAVLLLHHQHIDAPTQCGRVQAPIQLFHRPEHCLRQLPHIVHGRSWQRKQEAVHCVFMSVRRPWRFGPTPYPAAQAYSLLPSQGPARPNCSP